jgi:hypothetical protein
LVHHLQAAVGIDDGTRGISAPGMLLVNCGTELAQLVGCDLAQSGHRLLLPGIISDELCCFVDRRGNRPLRIFVPAEVNVAPAKQVTALTAFHALHESQHLSNLILHGERMAHPLLLRVQAFDEPHGGGAQHCRQYGCKPNASCRGIASTLF